MEKKDWLIVFGIAAAAFFFGRASNAPVTNSATPTDEAEMDDANAVQVIGGQAYYNLNFQMSGNAFNPFAQEYMPLFGFVANRAVF